MNVTLPLIIIADSHDGNIAYYSELIQASEHGGNIVSLVASHQPALLILDSGFTEPDSYQILNLIKSDPRTAHVPVLFIVGNLSERNMGLHQDLLRLVDVMAKPLNERQLQHRVANFLQMHRIRTQIATLGGEDNKKLIEGKEEGVLALDQNGQIGLLKKRASHPIRLLSASAPLPL